MADKEIKSIIEALIFSSPEPISTKKLTEVVGEKKDVIMDAIYELKNNLSERAIELAYVAGGWRVQTKQEFSPWIKKLSPKRKIKLSPQALVTLAIIAYKQPITRQEIEKIRGVDSTCAIKTLIDLELVEIAGQKRIIGNPFLYRTTKKFLSLLGLPDISGLPKIE
ncbi:TPA: SMC-Scp complex subunit ScpB [bacterium]|nr:SMC-Scp complex subunit ScpB [bacterium]